jgi:hypothetical protein
MTASECRRSRIHPFKGIEEINADPIVHRWKKFDALAAEH